MSDHIWWLPNVGAKLLSGLAIFSIFSSDITSEFDESIRIVLVKYLIFFLAGINAR